MPQRKDPKTGKRQRKTNPVQAERGKAWANKYPAALDKNIKSQRRKNQRTNKLSSRENLRQRRLHGQEMARQEGITRRRLQGYPKGKGRNYK